MIGVCVPAHNEAELLPSCLEALARAAAHPYVEWQGVRVTVVLDACDDDSVRICAAYGVEAIRIEARNVGIARDIGARRLITQGARWLAFTDADSRVAPNWLAEQSLADADAICGRIRLAGWSTLPACVRAGFRAYRREQRFQERIHGASLGVSAAAYAGVGGFPALASGEDRALVERLLRGNFTVQWSRRVVVLTSCRTTARAPRGLAARLGSFDTTVAAEAP